MSVRDKEIIREKILEMAKVPILPRLLMKRERSLVFGDRSKRLQIAAEWQL
jgi:hypothetical protein